MEPTDDRIEISAAAPHRYEVTVRGSELGRFDVSVPQSLPDDVGAPEEAALVRESFRFLLEREPASSILPEFSLDVIGRYFPEYVGAMRTRFGS